MAVAPDMNTSRSKASGAPVADFWRWWRGEIVRMLPQRFAAFGGGGSTPLVLLEGDEVIVIDPHAPPGAERSANLAGLDEGGKRALVRTQLESVGETRGRARAALRHHEALVRRVRLPAATEENLAQVLGFEMDTASRPSRRTRCISINASCRATPRTARSPSSSPWRLAKGWMHGFASSQRSA